MTYARQFSYLNFIASEAVSAMHMRGDKATSSKINIATGILYPLFQLACHVWLPEWLNSSQNADDKTADIATCTVSQPMYS